MKQDITFSIVTRAYNVEQYIEQCADSVLGQSYNNWEWIVLDNGSTDKTGQILKCYAEKEPRIRLYINETNYNKVEKSKEGLYRHIDLIKLARGKYLVDLDSDDFLDIEFLYTIWNVVCDKNVDIVAAGAIQFVNDNVEKVEKIVCPDKFCGNDITEMGNDIWNFYDAFRPSWGKAFFREFYIENVEYAFKRPLYLTNGGDTHMNLRFLQKAHSCVCLDKPLYYYRIRSNSTQRSNYFPNRYKSHDEIYYEGLRLLQIWNKKSVNNLYCLWLIHYTGLKSCIELLQNVKLEVTEYVCAIDRVLNDDVLIQYIAQLQDKYKKDMVQTIENTLDKIAARCGADKFKLELLLFTKNYGRQYLAKKRIADNSAGQEDILLYVLSAVSEKNILHYENELVVLGVQVIQGVECSSMNKAMEVIQQYKIDEKEELNKLHQLGTDLFAKGSYMDAARCFAIAKEWNPNDIIADSFFEKLVKLF